ncbi:Predicted HD superfamily hydrolase [Porphyromonas crevioricanis]|uniref:Predicted HD superfamily hydrolase n=1 Tax=Porphyromonas crevioricanis TaxID=393921 RepID=A0A2X4PLL7_9PORP|nr:HDIG domain-containing metalloprotein [Porphyromonas crevioricanis]GAD07434.1 membrane protein containing HD superfamily hydrolase domain, YQFF ortholog [Porphyromonas crevioricanis JCM 13913]SQH72693.1 Predicted HD superfamily hydrolase [Porphyromonas crevioricanis]
MNPFNIRPDKHIQSLLILLGAALLITLLAPSEQKFKYTFFEGKPWAYDLLTAPYDIPILKTKEAIKEEQDSLCERQLPYYNLRMDLLDTALEHWKNEFKERYAKQLPPAYYSYVEKQLNELYHNGMMDEAEKENLRANGKLEVMLSNSETKEAERTPISYFYTLKEAYYKIIDGTPEQLSKEVINSFDLSSLLRVNVAFNSDMSSNVMDEELRKISVSTGIVQTGERIVDKGEIVDARIYNVLNSFKIEYQSRAAVSDRIVISLATFALIAMFFIAFWLYLWIFRVHFLAHRRNVILFVSLLLFLVVVTVINIRLDLFNLYIIPFAILPLVVRTFFDSRTALFAHIVCVLSAALFVPFQYEFIVLQMLAGMTGIFSLRSLRSRVDLIRATFLIFVTYLLTYFALAFWQHGGLTADNWTHIIYFGINLIFLTFSYLLIYIIERLFGYVSIISLVELGDMNSPLLKELSERAPGTFQHSFQVSILATEAAIKIDADAALTRTGALYHDIGKMRNPQYFTENQGGSNPHESLSYDESARIIIRHVTDGIAMAQKYKLPDQVIDFIRTHHGEGKTKYFYNSYCNEHPGIEVDPAPFTYPGPNPFSKETAIVMMADAVEASSRSLKEYTEENIRNLIDRIVDSIVEEGLLSDAPITFRDIKKAKEVFYEKLKTIYHTRIAYPEKRA